MTAKWKARAVAFWHDTVKPFAVIVIVLCSFRSAVADWNDVPTGSMKPTILEGDRIFVNKLAYGLRVPFTSWRIVEWAQPRRGEVVILFSPADDVRLVKRVVGLPGDRIAMKDNRLFVNDEPAAYGPLEATFVNQIDADERPQHRFSAETIDGRTHPIMLTPALPALRSFRPVTVPEGQYFVLGDNRDSSRDSRRIGFVGRDRIVGRAGAIVMSLDRDRYYIPRWGRFFRSLP